MFKPKYQLTTEIINLLTSIAEAKVVIEHAKLLPKHELNLRRQAVIKTTHSSTAIEGNVLSIEQVEALYEHKKIAAPLRDVYEVKNYLAALHYIEKVVAQKQLITEKTLLRIHKLVTSQTLSKEQSGHYREKPVYVVRGKGGFTSEIIYTAPDAQKVPRLCRDLIVWIQKSARENINPIIVAAIVHQEIAAIHPFVDGNGRTARAIATLILYQRGYDFRHLFALEDYYNQDRQGYYNAINLGKTYAERKSDLTSWLQYFVTGFKQEIDQVKTKVILLSSKKVNQGIEAKVYLNKKQQIILDFIDRVGKIRVSDVVDILGCPKRTAQLELQKLKKLGTIKQVGKGPATSYLLK